MYLKKTLQFLATVFAVTVLFLANADFVLAACNSHSAVFVSTSDQFLSRTDSLGIVAGATTQNTSIEFWVKINSHPEDNILFALRDCADTPYSALEVWYYGGAGSEKLSFARGRCGVSNGLGDYAVTLTAGTWYHIAETWNGTTIIGYLNGSQVFSGTPSTAAGNNESAKLVGIGARTSGVDRCDCNIDDVRVYTSVLSGATISTDYSAPAELVGNEANLLAYWTFDSSLTTDLTSNNWTLTNNNTVTSSTSVPFPGTGCGGAATVNNDDDWWAFLYGN